MGIEVEPLIPAGDPLPGPGGKPMAIGDDLRSPYLRFTEQDYKMIQRKGPADDFGWFVRDYIDRQGVVRGQPKAGYVPAVGDLVINETSLNYAFNLAASTQLPVGRVVAVRSPTEIDVRYFIKGTIERFPYLTGSPPTRGQQVRVSTTPNQVSGVATGGAGNVVAVDMVPGTCDVAY